MSNIFFYQKNFFFENIGKIITLADRSCQTLQIYLYVFFPPSFYSLFLFSILPSTSFTLLPLLLTFTSLLLSFLTSFQYSLLSSLFIIILLSLASIYYSSSVATQTVLLGPAGLLLSVLPLVISWSLHLPSFYSLPLLVWVSICTTSSLYKKLKQNKIRILNRSISACWARFQMLTNIHETKYC